MSRFHIAIMRWGAKGNITHLPLMGCDNLFKQRSFGTIPPCGKLFPVVGLYRAARGQRAMRFEMRKEIFKKERGIGSRLFHRISDIHRASRDVARGNLLFRAKRESQDREAIAALWRLKSRYGAF